MLLMVEKGFRGEICYAIHSYAKANNKYVKHYEKIKNLSILTIGTSIIYMDGQCPRSYLKVFFNGLKKYLSLREIS